MKIRATQFVNFSYGDKRKDKSAVRKILEESKNDYDPKKDRYKKFREMLASYEEGIASEPEFLSYYESVANNKSAGYKILAENYLALKEDHGLVWDGRQSLVAKLGSLEVGASWYLHTDASNQQRIIFLNFQKAPLPRKQEKGLLTLLYAAVPESAGVGILNIQAGTLVLATRLDKDELEFLQQRADVFCHIADSL